MFYIYEICTEVSIKLPIKFDRNYKLIISITLVGSSVNRLRIFMQMLRQHSVYTNEIYLFEIYLFFSCSNSLLHVEKIVSKEGNW